MCESCDVARHAVSRRTMLRISAIGASTLAFGAIGMRTAWPVMAGVEGTPEAGTSAPHWTYEGEEGPDHWGDLSPDYAACSSGLEQSPINIINATHADLADIGIAYAPIDPMRIVNNGHTIQVNVSADPKVVTPDEVGNGITINGVQYGLAQFHFHTPSEHQIQDEESDMEMHLVHKTPEGNAVVLGILIKVGTTDNEALAPVFTNMATSKGPEQSIAAMLQPETFFPSNHETFRYNGSLTTPPCTEGIAWAVFTHAIEIGPDQLAVFQACFAENARPMQDLNGREIEEGE